jgi:hypothetical protein
MCMCGLLAKALQMSGGGREATAYLRGALGLDGVVRPAVALAVIHTCPAAMHCRQFLLQAKIGGRRCPRSPLDDDRAVG